VQLHLAQREASLHVLVMGEWGGGVSPSFGGGPVLLQVHRLNVFRPSHAKHTRMAHVRGPETQMDGVSS
jgi:hypothetical protein